MLSGSCLDMYFLKNILDFGNFTQNNFDDNKKEEEQERDSNTVWVITKDRRNSKTYTYTEAINLTGLIGMTIDMFGFSVVVSNSGCDLEIGATEKNILLSIPFIVTSTVVTSRLMTTVDVTPSKHRGTIISAYWWGYISDTRGRKVTLQIAMWGSFIAATLSTLSPDWITLAILKLISVSFCSCAQSVTYTWLGESCAKNIKDFYNAFLTTIACLTFPIYIILSYGYSYLDFSIDLHFITFVPWRLYALTLAAPLGICALSCHYFYESPKFAINIGDEKLALDILRKIWTRNRGLGTIYPVQKVILGEEGNISVKNESLLKSLWEQTVPLFKMPLLLRTLQLCYLTTTLYIASNSFYIWFPFITNVLINGITSLEGDTVQGLCDIIAHSQTNVSVSEGSCGSKTNATVAWTSTVQGLFLVIVNLSVLKLAHRRKLLMIMFLSISLVSAVGVGASKVLGLSVVLFYVMPIATCATGLVFTYFVDLYPTSYCGMAACLGVLVARLSSLFTVNVVGNFIISECSATFYFIAANLLGGIVVAYFLPPDKPIHAEPSKL